MFEIPSILIFLKKYWIYILIGVAILLIILSIFAAVNKISSLSAELTLEQNKNIQLETKIENDKKTIEEVQKRIDEVNAINSRIEAQIALRKIENDRLKSILNDINLSALSQENAEIEFNAYFQNQLNCIDGNEQCKKY